MNTCGLTHRGLVRAKNEDRWLVKNLAANAVLLAVADGMGGLAHGEQAARLAIDTLAAGRLEPALPPDEQVLSLMLAANDAILGEAWRPEAAGRPQMGTTLTLAVILNNKEVFWGQVGDSRLYHWRNQNLRQITTDQNMAQELVTAGRLSPAAARTSPLRNMLTQCLGCLDCRPTQGALAAQSGDLLLLCSDGLYSELPPAAMAELLKPPAALEDKAAKLINAALRAGGHDNITVVLAEFQAG